MRVIARGRVAASVQVFVGVGVCVFVGVRVGVGVFVGVRVAVRVAVDVLVDVSVTVGVAVPGSVAVFFRVDGAIGYRLTASPIAAAAHKLINQLNTRFIVLILPSLPTSTEVHLFRSAIVPDWRIFW